MGLVDSNEMKTEHITSMQVGISAAGFGLFAALNSLHTLLNEESEDDHLKMYFQKRKAQRCIIDDERIPIGFICPITQDVMIDPAILVETGQTYERREIENWLEKHDTCPVTGKKLRSKKLVTVWALKAAIEDWKLKNETPAKE